MEISRDGNIGKGCISKNRRCSIIGSSYGNIGRKVTGLSENVGISGEVTEISGESIGILWS